jgi:hypothetical protein
MHINFYTFILQKFMITENIEKISNNLFELINFLSCRSIEELNEINF